MVELKTLKDLKWHYNADGLDTDEIEQKKKQTGEILDESSVDVKLLKQEAIKWIKSITYRKDDEGWTLKHCDWIENFFNITEEDLKDEN